MTKYNYIGVLLFGFATASQAAIISKDFTGSATNNDCAGYFGTPFSSCTIFVDDNGVEIPLSPVIAKIDFEGAATEINTLYPTIDGSEFTVTGGNSNIGDWTYAPDDTADPGVRYWVAKGGPDFTLFWQVDASATAAGGACDVPDVYSLACLEAAQVVTAGDWDTQGIGNNNPDISHLTFYDTAIVPVPAAVWLFGSGLLGLVGVARRKRA